jgi:hypothetical protein
VVEVRIASKAAVLLLCGWAGGLSFRIIYEYVKATSNCYWPNTFDLWFDWIGLFLLACLGLAAVLAERWE